MPERLPSNSFPIRPPPSAAALTGLGYSLFRLVEAERPALADREALRQVPRSVAPPARGRTRIWEFGTNLHCSIIGTCLSTAELRQVLIKSGFKEAASATEHDVHASGVLVAGKHRDGAKLLHKALDRRHRIAISRFDRAKSPDEVRTLWQEAAQRGEIPGAYWAALTHPATNDSLVREIFSEVHMLSHLVGAANRADIRRLRQLEAENAALQAKAERQQQQLRDAVVSRDTTIRELNRALEERMLRPRDGAADPAATANDRAWEVLAADLKCRLTRSESRRERVERQLGEARAALTAERNAREAAERCESELRAELDAIEASLALSGETDGATHEARQPLRLTLLYVGGRQAGIGHLRTTAERCGAVFLHHDGGIEERGGLLPGLVSRADAVLFPVDCISHAAMTLVKRLCHQTGKPFLPLRSAGLAPFCAALGNPVLGGGRG